MVQFILHLILFFLVNMKVLKLHESNIDAKLGWGTIWAFVKGTQETR